MINAIKKNWIYGLFVFAVVFFIITEYSSKNQQRPGQIKISLKTFRTDLGWGYDICTNDTIFIHQEFIPAIEGRKGFVTEDEAKTIGNLAISKMKNKGIPMILLSEIDSCKITR
jgi:hypothetical protein